MSYDYYKKGSWNTICDRCGFKFKSDMLRKEWTGLMVCEECWETRHPSDLIRTPKDNPSVPWTRDQGTDVFISVTYDILTESDIPIYTESPSLLKTET